MVRSMSDAPTSERKRNVVPEGALRPDFVVIWTTPLPARAPYSDDAAAPRTTSMRSMSSEFKSVTPPLLDSVGPLASTTPSTMYRGPWDRPTELIDLGPRSSTDA